jgi:hypothetical protein
MTSGGRDVIKSISKMRNKTAASTEIIVMDANATSTCQHVASINGVLF